MIARELITEVIPPLKTSDTGATALKWMNEFQVRHLPIVNTEQFLGLISEDDILNQNAPDEPIGSYQLSFYKPYVQDTDHTFHVLRTMAEQNLSLVPVVDKMTNYAGVITLQNLLLHFARITSLTEPGGIIILEMNVRDFSLSEIAKIVEENEALIMSLFTSSQPDSTRMEVMIKINKEEVNDLLTTFERFEYTIVGFFQKAEASEHLKERYDSFIKYLNI